VASGFSRKDVAAAECAQLAAAVMMLRDVCVLAAVGLPGVDPIVALGYE
jgi:hypothetical protein